MELFSEGVSEVKRRSTQRSVVLTSISIRLVGKQTPGCVGEDSDGDRTLEGPFADRPTEVDPFGDRVGSHARRRLSGLTGALGL